MSAQSRDRISRAAAMAAGTVANQWAHLEPFPDDDTRRALDTMARLLRAADAEAEAEHVHAFIHQGLFAVPRAA